MHGRGWWLLGEVAGVGIVLAATLWLLAAAAGSVRYHGDEEFYNSRGRRYFGNVFLRQTFSGSEWADRQETHTQPMLANYVVGSWLWARTSLLQRPAIDLRATLLEKRRVQDVPGGALMAEIRTPMVALAAGAMAALYLLGRLLGGRIAGASAAALALFNPLAQESLVRAVAEAPLMLFILGALLLAVLGARRGRDGSLSVGWAVALGVALGLGFQTKLTAVLSLVAVTAWAALVAAQSARQGSWQSPGAALRDAWTAARGWVLALALALAVFTVTNPHLYPNPPLHTLHLFQYRADRMAGKQVQENPEDVLPHLLDRIRFVVGGSLVSFTLSGEHGLPLEAALASGGAFALVVRARRGFLRTGLVPVDGLVLVTVLAYFCGVSAFTLLAWPRYLVPPLLLGTLLSGIGLAALVGQARSAYALVRTGSRAVEGTAPTA